MKRSELENASRTSLVDWLEGSRGMMCRDEEEESTEMLRDCALDDYDACAKEEGFYESD